MNRDVILHQWLQRFFDPHAGLFYERLEAGGTPMRTGRRRLLTQCRQLITYADAVHVGINLPIDFHAVLSKAEAGYSTTIPGRWVFALDDDGRVVDPQADFYAHAFVILMYAALGRLDNTLRAHAAMRARAVLEFLEGALAHSAGGFHEGLDANGNPVVTPRRQNPHMHLFEAVLHAHETWGDPVWGDSAHALRDLFFKFFYDPQTHCVREFFTPDWTPHPDHGHRIEPGHLAEWIWLLGRYTYLFGDDADLKNARAALWHQCDAHGFQGPNGALVDAIDPAGSVLQGSARIWPQCEGIKACRQIENDGIDPARASMRREQLESLLMRNYMRDDGSWIEWRNADGHVQQTEQPGTTPYHLWFALKGW